MTGFVRLCRSVPLDESRTQLPVRLKDDVCLIPNLVVTEVLAVCLVTLVKSRTTLGAQGEAEHILTWSGQLSDELCHSDEPLALAWQPSPLPTSCSWGPCRKSSAVRSHIHHPGPKS
jgi:hypothetical protein